MTNELEAHDAPAGSVPAAVGLFMSVRQIGPAQAVEYTVDAFGPFLLAPFPTANERAPD